MSFTSVITADAKGASQSRKSSGPNIFVVCGLLALAGCHTPGHFGMATVTSQETTTTQAPTMDGAQAQSLASIKEVFDATAEEVPTLTAVGYAVVSSQPGKSDFRRSG